MIHSIEEFIQIPNLLNDLKNSRLQISEQLKTLEQTSNNNALNGQDVDELDLDLNDDIAEYESKLVDISEKISKLKSIEELNLLIAEYPGLEKVNIVDQLKALFELQAAKIGYLHIAKHCDSTVIPQLKTCGSVSSLSQHLKNEISDNVNYTPDEIEFIKKTISEDLSKHIHSIKNKQTDDFNRLLLDAAWDNPTFKNQESILRMQEMSKQLFELNKLHYEYCNTEKLEYWNFESIANNFKIKFIYHFNKSQSEDNTSTQSIEVFFKFMESYLNENLFKCIAIFTDESIGLSKLIVHDEFINHVLNPLRTKIVSTLNNLTNKDSNKHVELVYRLITQIFITDETMWEKFSYTGDGLITLLPNEILKIWIQFETDVVDKQYQKNFSDYFGLNKITQDGPNFVKYLLNLYKYFHPFLAVSNEVFFQYKIMVFKKIFLNLLKSFRESNMNYPHDPNNDELLSFEENIVRLKNMQLVYQTMYNLEKQSDCIILNTQFNKLTESNYKTLFQAELTVYKECIDALLESLVHRFKKMFGNSLRTYFKIQTWSSSTPTTDSESCSNELISGVSIISNTIQLFQKHLHDPIHKQLLHKYQLSILDIVIDYIINYIIKLNNFSESGYKQITQDYTVLKSAIGFQESEIPTLQDGSLNEILKLYEFLSFGDLESLPWLNKNYTKFDSKFLRLKETFDLKYAKNEDISYILYKCL